MNRNPQWPESRTSPMAIPALDSVAGKSYHQVRQTPGVLGGHNAVMRWYTDGVVTTPSGQMYRSVGGVWSLITATARVRVAPTGGGFMTINILALKPGEGSPSSVFHVFPLRIYSGFSEATLGWLSPQKQYPVGTIFSIDRQTLTGGASDLMVELWYRIRAAGQ